MLKKLLAGAITAVLSLGVVALVAGPASAHHNTISVSVTCATNGAYTVTWKVTNSEKDKTEVITDSNLPAVVPPNTTSFAFDETRTFPQTVTTPQDIELKLTGYWASSNVYSYDKGFISKNSFPTGCVKVTAVATPEPSICKKDVPNAFTDPSYTLAIVNGVQYTVGGTTTPGGKFPATNGTSVHIEASVTDPKYELVGQKVWDFTFTKPAGPCTVEVVPVAPQYKQQSCAGPGDHVLAQYWIDNTVGVLYSVKIDGVESNKPSDVSPGWHDIADGVKTIEVIARGDAAKFYTIKGDVVSFPVFTVLPAGHCLKDVEPKTPVASNEQCDVVNHPGVVPASTYTLFYVEHVIYEVSTNGGPKVDQVITKDTTFPAPVGSTIVVTARVDDPAKYQLKNPLNWTKKFEDRGDCKLIIPPVKPAATDQYCNKLDPNNPIQVQATITIPKTDNVNYFLDGAPVTAGPVTVQPGLHEVTAAVTDPAKYKLDAGVVLPFTFDIKPGICQPDFIVVPAAFSSQIGCFSAGSYTLSNDLNDANAVIWTVNGNPVAPGKYTVSAASTVTIVAAAKAPRYGLAPGAQTTWTVNFKKPTVCDLETLALTGQSPTGLLIAADLLVVSGLALFAVRAMRRRPQVA